MNGQARTTHGIVVGYDGSPGSQVALDWAAETARLQGKRLTIVHSGSVNEVPPSPPSTGESSSGQVTKSLADEGAERAGEVLDASDIETQYWLGSPASQLIEASKEADLVVVGSRARGRVRAGLLGSTSYAVTAHAECPVVVVRGPASNDEDDAPQPPRPGPHHNVVVGTDDSDAAARAVDAAVEFAEAERAVLHIVGVAHARSMEAWAYAETAKGGTDESRAVTDDAEQSVIRAANRVRTQHPQVIVTTEVLYGDAGQALAELGVNAGLVVVGSRGRGGFTGMLLGSVSHRVIHDAACPVMVVR
jgi:nucleotide-binding universal stress UspA family protein